MSDIKTKRYVVRICDACMDRVGQQCHTSDCLFWLCDVDSLPGNMDIMAEPVNDCIDVGTVVSIRAIGPEEVAKLEALAVELDLGEAE